MKNHLIPLLITILFLTSMVSPMVIGFEADAIKCDVENEELLDKLVFYCYSPNGFNTVKFEILKEQLLKYFPDEIDIVENEIQSVESLPIISSGGPMDSPWPIQSHDNIHTGRSPYNTAHIDGLEKWRYHVDGSVEDTPVIDNNNIIYFAWSGWHINAVYPNGTLKWEYLMGGYMLGSSPTIAEDGTIYVGCWDCKLYAINPNGTLKWKCKIGGTIASSPAIAEDGTIYVSTMRGFDKGDIVAINPNGTKKWSYETGYYATSDPAIGEDGTVYCGSGDYYFYALNPDGTLKWRFKTGDYIKGPASIADDGTVYIGSFDGYLYALYPNGTMRWRCKVGVGTSTNPSIADDGTIYVGGFKLYAVYPNGTMKWTFNPGEQRTIQFSSPAISADGTIYFGTNIGETAGGEIIAVNYNGTEIWRKKIAYEWVDSSPSIGEDGTVYVGSTTDWGGYLHAFGPIDSNYPPNPPKIGQRTLGKVGDKPPYHFTASDPQNNPLRFYIDWGDGVITNWTTERAPGEKCYFYHEWTKKGTYTIKAKAKDILDEESSWGELVVEIKKPRFSYLKGDIYDSSWVPYYGEWRFKAQDLFILQFRPLKTHKLISGESVRMAKPKLGIFKNNQINGFFFVYF